MAEVAETIETENESVALAVAEPKAGTLSLPDANEWSRIQEIADSLARSGIVPRAFRGKPADIVAATLAGRELGLSPMSAMQRIHVIEGKPTLSAEGMVGLVQRAGHEIWIDPASNEKGARVYGQRKGSDRVHELVFTMEEARAAGITGKDNWKKYPKAMLRARAISALCRIAFADVLAGYAYTPEEIGVAVTDEDGNVIETTATAGGTHEPKAPAETPAWITEAVETYGEEAVVEAAEKVRADLGVGQQITGIAGVSTAREGSDPQRRIVRLLERDYEPIAEAEVVEEGSAEADEVEHPCPICGSECEQHKKVKGEKTTEWWACSNDECPGDDDTEHGWTSFHNNPWKPGGQIETDYGTATESAPSDSAQQADASDSPPTSGGDLSPGVAAVPSLLDATASDEDRHDHYLDLIERALDKQTVLMRDVIKAQAVARPNCEQPTATASKRAELKNCSGELLERIALSLDLVQKPEAGAQ